MDTSTLLIVTLLVSAATLASYALSQWSSRGAGRSVGWAATSIGTTLLLTAAAIVVLAFVFRGLLWPAHSEDELEQPGSAGSNNKTWSAKVAAAEVPGGATSTPASPANKTARVNSNREVSQAGSVPHEASKQSLTPSLQRSAQPEQTGRGSTSLHVFSELDPWAATRCVYVFRPDSGNPTRWKIENGCDVPVGVVLSTCVEGSSECDEGASTSWKNPRRMILPAQFQRPITLEEQTVYGREVRHVACFVSTPTAVQLIGAPSEERSSASWREQFESVRESDGCLTRVKS